MPHFSIFNSLWEEVIISVNCVYLRNTNLKVLKMFRGNAKYILVIVLTMVLIGLAVIYTPKPIQKNIPETEKTVTKTNGAFTLVATYKQNNSWSYVLTGKLPTPCEQVQTDVLSTNESVEQVTVRLITSSSTDMCTQVISDYTSNGNFTASSSAEISLSVND